jgi:hypothetical protein
VAMRGAKASRSIFRPWHVGVCYPCKNCGVDVRGIFGKNVGGGEGPERMANKNDGLSLADLASVFAIAEEFYQTCHNLCLD